MALSTLAPTLNATRCPPSLNPKWRSSPKMQVSKFSSNIIHNNNELVWSLLLCCRCDVRFMQTQCLHVCSSRCWIQCSGCSDSACSLSRLRVHTVQHPAAEQNLPQRSEDRLLQLQPTGHVEPGLPDRWERCCHLLVKPKASLSHHSAQCAFPQISDKNTRGFISADFRFKDGVGSLLEMFT